MKNTVLNDKLADSTSERYCAQGQRYIHILAHTSELPVAAFALPVWTTKPWRPIVSLEGRNCQPSAVVNYYIAATIV